MFDEITGDELMLDSRIMNDLRERFEHDVSIQQLKFLVVVDPDGMVVGQLKQTDDGRYTLTVNGEFRGLIG